MTKSTQSLSDLKKEFRISLAVSNITQSAFSDTIGVSRVLVSNVLSGKSTSARVSTAIKNFIKQNRTTLHRKAS